MRTMAILNQKPKGSIFRSQNAGLSVRHFNSFNQSLNFHTFWRNPHLLVRSLPDMHACVQARMPRMRSFLLYFFPSQLLSKEAICKFSGLVALLVCLVLAAIGAIRFKDQTFSPNALQTKIKPFQPMPPLNSKGSNFFTQCIANQGRTFSANASIKIKDVTFSSNAGLKSSPKHFQEVLDPPGYLRCPEKGNATKPWLLRTFIGTDGP